jgi:hypothetical protein
MVARYATGRQSLRRLRAFPALIKVLEPLPCPCPTEATAPADGSSNRKQTPALRARSGGDRKGKHAVVNLAEFPAIPLAIVA